MAARIRRALDDELLALLRLRGPGIFRDHDGQVLCVRARLDGSGYCAFAVTWPAGLVWHMVVAPGALADLTEDMRVTRDEAADLGLAEFA